MCLHISLVTLDKHFCAKKSLKMKVVFSLLNTLQGVMLTEKQPPSITALLILR